MIKYIPFSDKASESIPSIICLGNFDGVHLGHSALLNAALEISKKLSLCGQKVRVGVLCFNTLSSDHFSKSGVPHLMSLEKKLNFFRYEELDFAYVCDFSKIKELSPTDFIENILIKECSCIGVVCGFNFKFGKNAVGDANMLMARFNKRIGNVNCSQTVAPVTFNDRIISSSYIRELIVSGDIEGANLLLGYNFSITHTIVHGKHLGAQLGFPTLNHIFSSSEIIPSFGIYATFSIIGGQAYMSVTNVGVRPTVSSSSSVTCETHLLGLENEKKDFYGQTAEIIFYKKLRDEKRFSSHAELSKAIFEDIEETKKYFSSLFKTDIEETKKYFSSLFKTDNEK